MKCFLCICSLKKYLKNVFYNILGVFLSNVLSLYKEFEICLTKEKGCFLRNPVLPLEPGR